MSEDVILSDSELDAIWATVKVSNKEITEQCVHTDNINFVQDYWNTYTTINSYSKSLANRTSHSILGDDDDDFDDDVIDDDDDDEDSEEVDAVSSNKEGKGKVKGVVREDDTILKGKHLDDIISSKEAVVDSSSPDGRTAAPNTDRAIFHSSITGVTSTIASGQSSSTSASNVDPTGTIVPAGAERLKDADDASNEFDDQKKSGTAFPDHDDQVGSAPYSVKGLKGTLSNFDVTTNIAIVVGALLVLTIAVFFVRGLLSF